MRNKRAKRGTVGIEVRQSKLRLRLPRTIAEVNARYISTGLDDTPENRRKAQLKAWEIEEDSEAGRLDTTLTRYAFTASSSVVVTKHTKAVSNLCEIWQAYCEYRKPLVATTTYKQKYCGYFYNHIHRLPSHSLSDAEDIRHHLTTTLSNDAAKRVLEQLNASCRWAVSVDLITHNPFSGMPNELRRRWSIAGLTQLSQAMARYSRAVRQAVLGDKHAHIRTF